MISSLMNALNLVTRLLLLLNPSYQTQPLQHKDVIQSNIRWVFNIFHSGNIHCLIFPDFRHKKPVIEVLEDRSLDN